jgi:hypothetical protein
MVSNCHRPTSTHNSPNGRREEICRLRMYRLRHWRAPGRGSARDHRQARRQDGRGQAARDALLRRRREDDPRRHRGRGHPHHDCRLLAPLQGRGLQLHRRGHVPREPARGGHLAAPGERREPGDHAGDGGRRHPHGLCRGQVHDQAVRLRGAGAQQDLAGRGRRCHRYDFRRRGGQGRLQGAPGGRGGQARWRLGGSLQAGSFPCCRRRRIQRRERRPASARGPRYRRNGRRDRGQRQDHRAPERQAHQDLRCSRPFLRRHQHRVGVYRHRELRRHRPGHGLQAL